MGHPVPFNERSASRSGLSGHFCGSQRRMRRWPDRRMRRSAGPCMHGPVAGPHVALPRDGHMWPSHEAAHVRPRPHRSKIGRYAPRGGGVETGVHRARRRLPGSTDRCAVTSERRRRIRRARRGQRVCRPTCPCPRGRRARRCTSTRPNHRIPASRAAIRRWRRTPVHIHWSCQPTRSSTRVARSRTAEASAGSGTTYDREVTLDERGLPRLFEPLLHLPHPPLHGYSGRARV